MTSAIITVDGLHKHFGHVHALDGLNLEVAQGEVHGFLGPNGSGKSTTIRVLLGILRATSGNVRLFGKDPWRDAVELHRDIAYVPGDVTLWPNLTGGETIDLLARMRGGIDAARRSELIERYDFDPRKKARTYSKGNRQKVALVSAFSSNASLLLLDEPTSGLDPLMEQVFRECVAEARERGATVLLSSHILSEVDALCERVTIIRAGKTVESGTLASMRHLSRTSITAELLGDPGDLSRIPGVEDITIDGNTVQCQVDSSHLGELIRVLGDIGVRTLVSAPPTLEELFLRHYETDGGAGNVARTTEKVGA
ncbi:ABC transporter ATP-binding protein [Antrihabitans sp. YC3-6]|uniref:ABC transporter ATP-binding protein n=1 Tax=Antrihabitans stalagmiti TaxID=2799499 RepID=A0A934NSX6_9NOCA|nr:ABC transporter ATP-binding protein [Antrihabitans stalagmiti]MBJ8340933.1 ABC transporter ATP-binding protein [Antrihabitans stalagmiti]